MSAPAAFDYLFGWEDSRYDEDGVLLPHLRVRRPSWNGGGWSVVREFVLERDGHRCRYCGFTEDLAIDHIRPIARGGTNAIRNLQVLCSSCNSRKGHH